MNSDDLDAACKCPLDIYWGMHKLKEGGYQVSLVGGCWHLNEVWRGPTQEKAIEKALASIEAWRAANGNGEVREDMQPRFKGVA
jgi:hypothetical protein